MEGFFNHMNPALLTKVMTRMNEKEFEDCAFFIMNRALDLSPGLEREKYVRLHQWCQAHRKKVFHKNEPSLFDDP